MGVAVRDVGGAPAPPAPSARSRPLRRGVAVRGAGGALALALLMSCGGAEGARTDAGGGAGWAVERAYANGGVEVLLRLDRSEITTAEWARLEVTALAPEGLAVRLPAAQQAEAGGLQVAQTRTSPPALQEDGRVRWVRRFELRPFLAGEYEVPGLVVDAGEAGGGGAGAAATEVRTEAIALSVASVLPAGEEAPALREVEGPLPVPPPAGRVLLFAALAAAVAGAAVTGVILLRRRAARARAQAEVVPPHEAALQALRELAAGGLLQRDLLAFHTAVAAVVRRYLEQRFGVRAPQRTTEELLFILAAASWLDDFQRRALHAFLAQCDQVKFARARPAAAASEGLIDTAVELVTATRPTDTEAADAEAAPNVPGPPEPGPPAAEAARAV